MSKQPPKRVRDCIRHFNGCQCREWRFEQMQQALRIIRTWAACDSSSPQTRLDAMNDIANKAAEGLLE